MRDPDLISVVIPCYNAAQFLGEAIESILAQTYTHYEIIVIDDGSTDQSADVAAKYPEVRLVRQSNQGTAAARNTGILESAGSYLVFLDVDDKLLPLALKTGVDCLHQFPDCAFAFGLCRLISGDGSSQEYSQKPRLEKSGYLSLLRGGRIWHPAAVLFRRSIFDEGMKFDTSLPACSDYEFYLRVARTWPIHGHNQVISEYRQHNSNKSVNVLSMVDCLTRILSAQREHIAEKPDYEEACRQYKRDILETYYKKSIKYLLSYPMEGGPAGSVLQNASMLIRYTPVVLPRMAYSALRLMTNDK
jgi:glycosyltransferase involved in cell wall biosynthesis